MEPTVMAVRPTAAQSAKPTEDKSSTGIVGRRMRRPRGDRQCTAPIIRGPCPTPGFPGRLRRPQGNPASRSTCPSEIIGPPGKCVSVMDGPNRTYPRPPRPKALWPDPGRRSEPLTPRKFWSGPSSPTQARPIKLIDIFAAIQSLVKLVPSPRSTPPPPPPRGESRPKLRRC